VPDGTGTGGEIPAAPGIRPGTCQPPSESEIPAQMRIQAGGGRGNDAQGTRHNLSRLSNKIQDSLNLRLFAVLLPGSMQVQLRKP